jgi:N6-adenosine-specific RNA methylase IME4
LDLKAKIYAVAEDDNILFLWTTQAHIWNAKALLDHWGFEYREMIIWDKQDMGLGRLLRIQCEFCLIGLKGKPLLDNPKNIRDIICEAKREHSRKPEKFYEIVEQLCKGSKGEFFARQQRPGYDVFGNETQKFNASVENSNGESGLPACNPADSIHDSTLTDTHDNGIAETSNEVVKTGCKQPRFLFMDSLNLAETPNFS